MKHKICVVIPIYKKIFSSHEKKAVINNCGHLCQYDIYFAAPRSMDCGYYQEFFSEVQIARFPDKYFKNIDGYNRLLLRTEFYGYFIKYQYMLICQPDVWVLGTGDSIDELAKKGYDYIGAPWFPSMNVTWPVQKRKSVWNRKYVLHVGNGGFSLRHIEHTIKMLKKHFFLRVFWKQNEDLFYSLIGEAADSEFKIPDVRLAGHFALEKKSKEQMEKGIIPVGVHAYRKFYIHLPFENFNSPKQRKLFHIKCKICGNRHLNQRYIVKERMVNKGDTFTYVWCSRCGTLQLCNPPEQMDEYYKKYPVFQPVNAKERYSRLEKTYMDFLISRYAFPLRQKELLYRKYKFLECLAGQGVKKTDKILDVGCGTAGWLSQLEKAGFSNLYGIDKYVPDQLLKKRTNVYQGELSDLKERDFDLITLHHSFEHMQNPEEVLRRIYTILKADGICIIRIPVTDGVAWKKYRADWYQIDAPRHFFLYSEKAVKLLCEKAGFEVYDMKYDSAIGQFYVSEKYRTTRKSFSQICGQHICAEEKKKYERMARQANRRNKGDQAVFYLKKRV